MRAVVYDKTGDSSVLHVGDIPKPTVGPSDALVKIDYAGSLHPSTSTDLQTATVAHIRWSNLNANAFAQGSTLSTFTSELACTQPRSQQSPAAKGLVS